MSETASRATRIRDRGRGRHGRASALAFAREGASVFATDIDEKGLAALAKDGVSEVAKLDVRATSAVAALAKRVGPIDILLNAAGFVHHGTVLECSDEDWGFFVRPQRQIDATGPSGRFFCPACWNPAAARSSTSRPPPACFKAAPNRYVYGATKAAVAH